MVPARFRVTVVSRSRQVTVIVVALSGQSLRFAFREPDQDCRAVAGLHFRVAVFQAGFQNGDSVESFLIALTPVRSLAALLAFPCGRAFSGILVPWMHQLFSVHGVLLTIDVLMKAFFRKLRLDTGSEFVRILIHRAVTQRTGDQFNRQPNALFHFSPRVIWIGCCQLFLFSRRLSKLTFYRLLGEANIYALSS